VGYTLRYSLAATLGRKFKTSLKKIFQMYGKDLSIQIKFQKKIIKIAGFPNKSMVDSIKHSFNADNINFSEFNQKSCHIQRNTSLLASLDLFKTCGVVDCNATNDIEIHCTPFLVFS
jgi:hypothetical protein